MRTRLLAASLWLTGALTSAAVSATEVSTADEDARLTSCLTRARTEPDIVRSALITTKTRHEEAQSAAVMMYGRRSDEGRRELLIRFVSPQDLRDAGLLILERESETETYFVSPDLGSTVRITGTAQASTLLGTNFSYEDMQLLEGFLEPGQWIRRDDDKLEGRPTFVAEIRPQGSSYERIVSWIDKESCVPLMIHFHEHGNFITKELRIAGDSLRKIGSSWIPHSILMQDRRNDTTTQIRIDRAEQDPLPAELFSLEALRRRQPPSAVGAEETQTEN